MAEKSTFKSSVKLLPENVTQMTDDRFREKLNS